MIVLNLLFVAASLLTQAWMFRDPDSAEPATAAYSNSNVTQDSSYAHPRDRSTAESDTSRTGETWVIR